MTAPAKPPACPHVARLLASWRASGGWTEARAARLQQILDARDAMPAGTPAVRVAA